MFTAFMGSLLSLVLCMAAGFVCRKLRVLDDTLTSGISSLMVKVTMPCAIFISMLRPFTQTLLLESLGAFFLSGAVFLAGGALGLGLARLMKAAKSEHTAWTSALIFANVGYMGLPVTQAVFGDAGMIYTVMANASFNLLCFTVGTKLYTGKSTLKKVLTNPALIAIALGFVFFLAGLRPPKPVADTLSMIGAMTTPISMLVIGSLLAKNKLRSLFNDARVLPVIGLRLLIVPFLAWLALRPVVRNELMLGVLVVMSAMPVAAITAIFAEEYKGDTALASKLVVLSTLLCVLTIPLMTLLL